MKTPYSRSVSRGETRRVAQVSGVILTGDGISLSTWISDELANLITNDRERKIHSERLSEPPGASRRETFGKTLERYTELTRQFERRGEACNRQTGLLTRIQIRNEAVRGPAGVRFAAESRECRSLSERATVDENDDGTRLRRRLPARDTTLLNSAC